MSSHLIKSAILSALLVSASGNTAEKIQLSLGEWRPYISESSENYGYFTQIVTEAFEAAGYEVNYQFLPWKRALYVAKEGEVDGVVAVTKSPEREKDFWYSEYPVLVGERVFFYSEKRPIEWSRVSDLKGIHLGATFEYYYGTDFEQAEKDQQITVERVATDAQNFKKLITGRIQAFPITREIGYYILKNELGGYDISGITHHPKALVSTPFYIILSKKIKQNQKLIQDFNRGLAAIKENGRYQQLIDMMTLDVKG